MSRFKITYELRHVLCGKPRCRALHGPYWYAYFTGLGGKKRSIYVGKNFRPLEPSRNGPTKPRKGDDDGDD